MRKLSLTLILSTVVLLTLAGVRAQNDALPVPGDPPILSQLSISEPNEKGVVTISGAVGSVFPNARVIIRNLYTEQTAYVEAGIMGRFQTELFGPGNTPFWVNAVSGSVPEARRSIPGSLPGGPGTIIYGAFPTTRPPVEAQITRLIVDGDLADWGAYQQAQFASGGATIYALKNRDALYVAASNPPSDYQQLQVVLKIDSTTYQLALDPRTQHSAVVTRLAPIPGDEGAITIAAAADDGVELRFDPGLLDSSIVSLSLDAVRYADAEGAVFVEYPVAQPILTLDEATGIFRPDGALGADAINFHIAGAVAQGASIWRADGRIDGLGLTPGGDPLRLELDVRLNAPGAPDLAGLSMIGRIALQPIVVGKEVAAVVADVGTNNGWSNLRTPSGLALDNLSGGFVIAETTLPAPQVFRSGDDFIFPLDFTLMPPDDLPPGLYVPVFAGWAQLEGRVPARWEANGIFGRGNGISRAPLTRLPLVLNAGGVASGRLLWTLFQDSPSSGSRGVLADEDRDIAALSNRVRFDSPTYILPLNATNSEELARYPLEPYLLNQMPNAYDSTAAPLIPFLFPGGRLNVQVTRPDGGVDNLGSMAILQSQLSTPASDERDLFGRSSQVDVYRLTTLNPFLTAYAFKTYGDYTIKLTGNLEDVWGNRYEGGGTYHVTVAEALNLTPGVLPGTPFEVGDTLSPVAHVAPAVPADVTVTVRVYPLDGAKMIERVFTGTANRYGYFRAPGAVFAFRTPGEYTIDYEARYTDSEGRLWAASQRSAGVIAKPDGDLIAHGARGLSGLPADVRPAWFNGRRYAAILGVPDSGLILNTPYHSGDVAWMSAQRADTLTPTLSVQDRRGAYQSWLLNTFPDWTAPNGLKMQQLAVEDELPAALMTAPGTRYGAALMPEALVNRAYTYISAVRPGVTLRQMVIGSAAGGLPLDLDTDDPLHRQIGAGYQGTLAGDYVFLFGGVIVHNKDAGVEDAAIYGTVLPVIANDDPDGVRVFPPYNGEAGGARGGSLLTVREQPVGMFFHPTGVQPGQTLVEGDTLTIAGQVAPTLPSIVTATITAPSGTVRQFEGLANAIGYFYDPANDFVVDEVGVWTVEIRVRHEGLTSAGRIEPPPPTGGVLGAEGGRFAVYVVPDDAELLPWERPQDQVIPASSPFNFTFSLPSDWTGVQVYRTLTMPGYVMEDGALRPTGGSVNYPYIPTELKKAFPNYETEGQLDGAAVSDVLTLTFTMTGTDAQGSLQARTRVFTIMHDRLLSLE